MKKVLSIGGALCCALVLGACGGGGDGGDGAPPPPPPPPATYTIGGTTSGLASGASVVLQNNGGGDLTVGSNGPFTFTGTVQSGSSYSVTVLTQPASQNCTVANGSGTATANVTNVAVTCANTDTVAPTIGSRRPLPTTIGTAVTGGVVVVTFSEPMDPASLTTSTLTLTGRDGPVQATVTLAANNTQATLTPTSRLAFDAEYTATVTTGAKDAAGNALASASSWKFNTGKALSLGWRYSCARFVDGRVKCWGENAHGQLGIDSTTTRGNGAAGADTRTIPAVNLGTGRTAVAISAGDYHACAILDDGTAKCWGRNVNGELGQGVTGGANANIGDQAGEMAALQPIDFGPGRRVLEIAAGQDFTCARLDDATVKCWGRGTDGRLGIGSTAALGIAQGDIAASAGVALGTGLTPVQLSLGHYHACAILADGAGARSAKCWGDNQWGQLGRGNVGDLGDAPGELGDALPAIDLGTGRSPLYLMATGGHSCALLDDRSTKCWGLNTWGQIGLAAGNNAPFTDGQTERTTCNGASGPTRPLDCIGDQPGEMGDALPAAVAASQTTRLSIGFRHNCVQRVGSTGLYCWGSNEQAQLGTGSGGVTGQSGSIVGDEPNEIGTQPATLVKGRTIEELTAGGFHTCVMYSDLTINCWGFNNFGQLGRNQSEAIVGDAAAEMGEALIDVDLGT